MTLNNDFYYITETRFSEALPTFRIRLNPEHYIFKAHFPGNPIVPGVCQVKIISELLEKYLGRRIFLSGIKNIKYLSVIIPTEDEILDIIFQKITVDENGVNGVVSILSNDKLFAKISLMYIYKSI